MVELLQLLIGEVTHVNSTVRENVQVAFEVARLLLLENDLA